MHGWRLETVYLNSECVAKLCTRMCRSDTEFGVVATDDIKPATQTVCDDNNACTKASVCTAGCNVDVIQGTKLLSDHEDAELYGGAQIAVTPIDEDDVAQRNKRCGWPVNLVAHTHPEYIQGASQKHAYLSPPSLGDLFAHTILANYRNYKENHTINSFLVFAAEGVYMYGITPSRFTELAKEFEARAEAEMQGLPANHPIRADFEIGNVPDKTYEGMRAEFFDRLRPANDAFFGQMISTCQRNPDMFGLVRPKILAQAKHWSKDVGDDFDGGGRFDAMVRNPTPKFREMVETLVGPRSEFVQALINEGLFCVHYPLSEFVNRPLPVVVSVPPPKGGGKF